MYLSEYSWSTDWERREENQLDATECFIAIQICSTCFGHSYAHHQKLETILVLLPHMVCNALVAGVRLLGVEQQAMRSGWGKLCDLSHNYDARTNIHQILVKSSWVFWWNDYYHVRTRPTPDRVMCHVSLVHSISLSCSTLDKSTLLPWRVHSHHSKFSSITVNTTLLLQLKQCRHNTQDLHNFSQLCSLCGEIDCWQ